MRQFETARLLMRPLCPEDQAFYCFCYTDPVLMRHIGDPLTHPAALRSFNAALKTTSVIPIRRHTWAMQEKISGNTIGLLALFCDQTKPEPVKAELGNIMLTRFQNKGYTVEALAELINIAFEKTGLEALLGKHQTDNTAAARVMRKLAFMPDPNNSDDHANSQWILHRHQWQARRTATDSR